MDHLPQDVSPEIAELIVNRYRHMTPKERLTKMLDQLLSFGRKRPQQAALLHKAMETIVLELHEIQISYVIVGGWPFPYDPLTATCRT